MNKISNLIPITLSLSSIGILFYIFLPLITSEFIIINEDQIIPFFKFKKIFNRLSKKYKFKTLFKNR